MRIARAISLSLAIGGAALLVAANAQVSAPRSASRPREKVVLVGDSTVAPGSGWGDSFCRLHVRPGVACVNMAAGGRSSRTFRSEGLWAKSLAEAQTPGFSRVYVFIQFGHNDDDRSEGEFFDNMRRYVEDSRAVGVRPILVTSLVRRRFKDGRLQNDLLPWANITRRVARAERAPLVDLNRDSAIAVQKLGPVGSSDFAGAPPSSGQLDAMRAGTSPFDLVPTPRSQQVRGQFNFDYTHLGPAGGAFFAAIVARDAVAAAPELRGVIFVSPKR